MIFDLRPNQYAVHCLAISALKIFSPKIPKQEELNYFLCTLCSPSCHPSSNWPHNNLLEATQLSKPQYARTKKYHAKNLNLLKFISCPAENWMILRQHRNMGIFSISNWDSNRFRRSVGPHSDSNNATAIKRTGTTTASGQRMKQLARFGWWRSFPSYFWSKELNLIAVGFWSGET